MIASLSEFVPHSPCMRGNESNLIGEALYVSADRHPYKYIGTRIYFQDQE